MTIQEAKDQIAKSHNYNNWYDLQSKVPPAECYWHLEQVAELYARSKWDEACEAQRFYVKEYLTMRKHNVYVDGIAKPEFKP